jgi:hypothetical protein
MTERALQPADLVLRVTRIADALEGTTYRVEAMPPGSGVGGRTSTRDLGTFEVTRSARQESDELVDRLRATKNVRSETTDPQERTAAIRELGCFLWELLPAEFHDYYWSDLHQADLSLLVLTDDLRFPWELVWPHQGTIAAGLDHLFGMAFSMARWPQATGRLPGAIRPDGGIVVAVAGKSDTCAGKELAFLSKAPGGAARPVAPANLEDLKRELRRRPAQVLHIRAHGGLAEDGAAIQLSDKAISPSDVPALEPTQLSSSLVFMNVCEAMLRRPDRPFRVAGWGGAFAGAGSAAVVGPYRNVSDRVSASVARWFYEQLWAGSTVGEAMRSVRRRFTDMADGPAGVDICAGPCGFAPTCVGYTVVGHPNAWLVLGRMEENGRSSRRNAGLVGWLAPLWGAIKRWQRPSPR